MSTMVGSLSPRGILICAAVLVTFWLWRKPFELTSKSLDIFYTPQKLYESEAAFAKDNPATASQSLENPKAPSIPAFQDSALTFTSNVYNPYPEYNSRAWRNKWKGKHAPCRGPRDEDVNWNPDDMLFAHRLRSKALQPLFGSYKETGLHSDFCFDRHSRFDPYSYGEDEGAKGTGRASQPSKVLWNEVNWGQLQQDCLLGNENRFKSFQRVGGRMIFWTPAKEDHEYAESTLVLPTQEEPRGKSYGLWQSHRTSYKQRTAIVLRTWDGNEWTIDTIQFVRAYIMELVLHSGAEYEVIILVEVKDVQKPIFMDPKAYQEVLANSVPNEFVNMTLLFNRDLLEEWYPKVGKHDPSTSQIAHMNQPLQLLSLLRPDLEQFWQVELDVRYTGHHYHHLETISTWAKAEPRRLQWERASRYYVSSIHGSWSNFMTMIENATTSGGVWGPIRTQGIKPIGPEPPTVLPSEDNYSWGVGEEADLVDMAPVFDVEGSNFLFKDVKDHYPDGERTPARATANTSLIRMSKRLLRTMHHGQVNLGLHMFPEMYAESTALHHGLKLVVFPSPTYLDYAKSPAVIEEIFNADKGSTLLDVPYRYSDIWHRMSYWSSMDRKTNYADELYKRWLAHGGDTFERLCLPSMLLHPVKGV